jgi:hypothetical protein
MPGRNTRAGTLPQENAWADAEALEPRILLDGDHPELPVPFVPGVGTVVVLDMNGQGSSNGTISAPMGSNPDDDLFRFTVATTDFVTILANTAGLNSTLDNAINVFDSTGALVASGNNNGPLTSVAPQLARDGWVGFIAQPGEYYVQVVAQNNTTGDYQLRVDTQSDDIGVTIPTMDDDPMMPDPARLFTPTSGEFWVEGSITQLQGEDVYFVDVPNDPVFDSVASITTKADATLLDARLEVYDAQGHLISQDSDSGYLNNSFTSFKVTPGQRFYVRIRSDDLQAIPTQSPMGDYTLRFDLAGHALSTPVDPITRRGSDMGHAMVGDPRMIMMPDVLIGPTDFDLYFFQAQGTGLTFVTLVDGPPPEGGFAIYLYDQNGTQIAFDDDFIGNTPQVEVDLVGGMTYWVVVASFEPPQTPAPMATAPYQLFVEAHHTTDETVPVDDHVNTPPADLTPDQRRRAFDLATPLKWNDPRLLTDADGNPIFDHAWVTDAIGTGRVHNASDTDLFSFVPPMDLLGSYAGNNDDNGTSVYVGGNFLNADPDNPFSTNSAGLATWDAGDWWFVGPQGTPMVPLGLVDNVNTPATDHAEVYVLYAIQQANSSGQPILLVGGDFTLQLTPDFSINNLAAWAFNPLTGRYGWFQIGAPDGPVRAITEFDPALMPDNIPNQIIIGGDFSNVTPAAPIGFPPPAPQPASRIASFTFNPIPFDISFPFQILNGAWAQVGTGITGNSVNALAVYDPADPGEERPAGMGLPQVNDTPDPNLTLFVGGDFTNAGGVAVTNLAGWDGMAWTAANYGTPTTNGNINGPVHTLTVWDPPDPEGGDPADPVLVIGGDFTMAGGVAANNIVVYGRVASMDHMPPDPNSDPMMPVYQPRLLYEALGANGVDDTVFTAVVATHFNDDGTENGQDLIIGGAFQNAAGAPAARIAVWDGMAWSQPFGAGFDDTVFSLAVVTDQQEPGLLDDQEILYAAGAFMNSTNPTPHVARFNPNLFFPDWESLNSGVDGTAFAIAAYDDGNPNEWDRNDRPSSKAVITVAPEPDAFANFFVNVYDSNLNLIYSNDTKNPIGQDPAGSIDPSLAPGANTALVIPELWAGETYYIEVSSATQGFRQTGRYTVSVSVDAVPIDVNMDGSLDDPIATVFEEPDAGDWIGAQRVNVQAAGGDQGEGDGTNRGGPDSAFVENQGGRTVGPPIVPASGNYGRQYTYPRFPTLDIGATPSRFLATEATDYGNIESIDDTDLYFFRAAANGYVEVRINTTNISDFYFQRIWDLNNNPPTAEETLIPDAGGTDTTLSSKLQSMIRVFDNDHTQIDVAGYNPAIGGENDTTTTGRFGDRTYYNRDARIVIPVQANRVYFVQVESGQLPIFNTDPGLVDWRFATGAYELLINSIPDFTPDFADDVADTTVRASPFPIGIDPANSATNGRGSINGTIRDVINNPDERNNDRDLYFYYATGNGPVNLTASAVNSNVSLSITILNDTGGTVATGLAVPGGSIGINWVAEQGQRFYVRVDGAGGTQGNYRVDIVGVPYADDHANVGDWIDASTLTVNTFLGTATASGTIETPGDTDVFVFNSDQWTLATVLVETASPNTLNPFVRVYEIQEDPAGNQYFAQIAYNDNNPDGAPGTLDSFARFSVSPDRSYYVVVQGVDPNFDFGNYNVTVRVAPTDDHPNRQYFPLSDALNPTVDSSGFAVANATGRIEIEADDDVFRFIAPAAGVATVTLTRTSGDFDPLLFVQNSNGVDLPASPSGDSGTPGVVTISFNVVRSQTYYIVVDVDTDGGTGAYTVNLQTPANDDHANATEFSLASVITISSTTGVGTRSGTISPAVDTDLFRFNARVVGDAVINLTTPNSTLNPRIQVFDSNFNIIPGSSDDTDTATQTVTATVLNQVFYVLVLSDTNGGGAQTGAYTISVTQTIGGGGGGGGGGQDDHANAGNFGNASPITLDPRTGDGSLSGIINSVGDTDLFRFTTPALTNGQTGNRPVYIQVVTPAGGLVDGTVRVFRENSVTPGEFDLVAADSNGIPGATASLKFDAPGNTTYYILVEPVGANLGSYNVRVDTEPNVQYLYYPEGYAASTIDEFVPIVNPNSFDVTYTVIARYETGVRDQTLVSNVVIPANSRGGFTITRHEDPTSLTRRDTPYALEIQSNGQLGATFAHYDFGVTTGENFTNRISTTWTFAQVNRDGIADPAALGNLFNDYVIFYNPNNADVSVNITMTYDDGTVTTFTRTVGALRRSGINFDTDDAVTRNGRFSVRLSSSAPIVAAMSSYDIQNGRGFGLLGDADGGSTTGVVPNISSGNGVDSSVALYNASGTTASVTITASYTQANLPDLVRVVSLNPGARRTYTLADLGVVAGQPVGLRYTSTQPITFSASEYKNGDGDASASATVASQTAVFGDAFVTPGGAGNTYIEQIGLYNPANTAASISIRFLFADGTVSNPVVINVAAHRFALFQVDQADAILNGPTPAFSTRIDSITPFVASFTHYDLFLGGGWSTIGAPIGLTDALSTIA